MSTSHLPPHASVVASPEVWMESDAIDQLGRVARMPACVRAVGMPDLHPGRGVPIGAAFLFEGCVLPDLVGGDLGCGVLLLAGKKAGPRGDALERRLLAALEEALLPDVDREALLRRVWAEGTAGLAKVPGVPEDLATIGAMLGDATNAPNATNKSGALPDTPGLAEQLGSIGGGNHFLEIARVDRVEDRAFASRMGLARDATVILVHTGSRALGGVLAARYAGRRLEGDALGAYLGDLRGAVRYARANRLLVAWRVLGAAGIKASRLAGALDLVHNAVEPWGERGFLHRKGAAPAQRDEGTVVLGSRGSPSWVMRGLGKDACLACVAHGAGRRMARSEARAKLGARHTRASLERTAIGARVICGDTALMYEEHPDAYKAIEPVVASLEAEGAAQRVAALVPLVTVKR